MMIKESCGCGASIEYPDHLGLDGAADWRTTHRHKQKEDPEPQRQGAGFASVTHSSAVMVPAKFHEQVMA